MNTQTRNRRLAWRLTTLAAAASTTAGSLAQTAPPGAKDTGIQEVVISAERTRQTTFDAPANVAFDGEGSLLVTNHAIFTANPGHMAVLSVFVDDDGRRFANESAAYDRLGRAVLAAIDDGSVTLPYWMVYDSGGDGADPPSLTRPQPSRDRRSLFQ